MIREPVPNVLESTAVDVWVRNAFGQSLAGSVLIRNASVILESVPADKVESHASVVVHWLVAVNSKEGRMKLSRMKSAALIAALALSGCASLGQTLSADQSPKRHELKDGSILIVDANGRMRMFDLYGAPLYMKDGVAMELKDGTVVPMKESIVWQQLRTRGSLGPRS